jgi:hypothetical protein
LAGFYIALCKVLRLKASDSPKRAERPFLQTVSQFRKTRLKQLIAKAA